MYTTSQPLALTPDQLAPLLERLQLPAATAVTPLGRHTLLLDDDTVLQVCEQPQRLQKTAAIYQKLRAAGLPAPAVLHISTADEPALLAMSRLAGSRASAVWPQLSQAEREALAEALGGLVARIHQLSWLGYGDLHTDGRFGGHSRWMGAIVERILQVMRGLDGTSALPRRLIDGVVTAINDGDSLLETASRPALTHGAIEWRNVLVAPAAAGWEITGLLGWSRALLADAAWEFAQLWFERDHSYPDPDYFTAGYKPIRKPQPDRWPRSQLYRLLLHLEGALAAHTAGDSVRRQRHEWALTRALGR